MEIGHGIFHKPEVYVNYHNYLLIVLVSVEYFHGKKMRETWKTVDAIWLVFNLPFSGS
jgi:hypothetical protein